MTLRAMAATTAVFVAAYRLGYNAGAADTRHAFHQGFMRGVARGIATTTKYYTERTDR